MHETNSIENRDFSILGIKIFEICREYNFVLEHKPIDENDKPLIIDSDCSTVIKIFGFPIFKATDNNKHDIDMNDIKAESKPINIPTLAKNILILAGIIILFLTTFIAGIYTANTEWFNDRVYIQSRQMQNLSIKSLKLYDKALFEDAESQYDLNVASEERYKHYHEYYEKVVEKIKNYDFWNENDKNAVLDYINGYEERKAKIDFTMFPCKDNQTEECSYGTYLGSAYPKAMLEFDRQELLTYRMILSYMYDSVSNDVIYMLFAE